MHRLGLYRTEVEFYRQLSADAGIPTPRCYYADIDTQSGYFVLVMEDMRTRGRRSAAADGSDVEVAIDHIAGFHARWWKHPGFASWTGSSTRKVRVRGARRDLKLAFSGRLPPCGNVWVQFPEVLSEACDRILAGWPAFVRREYRPRRRWCTATSTRSSCSSIGTGWAFRRVRLANVDHRLRRRRRRPNRCHGSEVRGSRDDEHRLIDRYYDGLLQHGVVRLLPRAVPA
jgi:hypothetical protein